MRLFVIDRDEVVTLDDVRNCYELYAEDGDTFNQYLANCLSKNGSLDEVLSAETPREYWRCAVIPCTVIYDGEDASDRADLWLTQDEIADHIAWGHEVVMRMV